jgi:hypothetical protein
MNKQPELQIDKDGTRRWHINHRYYHCEDGPAIEHPNGSQYWYLNGSCHRVDGPAIIHSNGNKYWCLNGKEYSSKEEWFRKLTPEQQYNYLWNLDE